MSWKTEKDDRNTKVLKIILNIELCYFVWEIIGIYFKANCKLADVPSGIANDRSTEVRINKHLPLNGERPFN